jgi:hypothetical protein
MNFVCNVLVEGEKKGKKLILIFFVLNATFSYIMATSVSGGGREPPTMKPLENIKIFSTLMMSSFTGQQKQFALNLKDVGTSL